LEPYKFLFITPNPEINNPPRYATPGSAGFDIQANEDYILRSGEKHATETGLHIFINEDDLELQIRPRSGLAIKHGITIINAPGTVDSDYQGEIKVLLWNTSDTDFPIHKGDRIAQGVFSLIMHPNNRFELGDNDSGGWIKVNEFPKQTQRGDGAFGSTGI
jgi:dUTP pyrophosphatase